MAGQQHALIEPFRRCFPGWRYATTLNLEHPARSGRNSPRRCVILRLRTTEFPTYLDCHSFLWRSVWQSVSLFYK